MKTELCCREDSFTPETDDYTGLSEDEMCRDCPRLKSKPFAPHVPMPAAVAFAAVIAKRRAKRAIEPLPAGSLFDEVTRNQQMLL